MTETCAYFRLARIERRKLRELDTCWHVSTAEMTKVAKELLKGEKGTGDVSKLAKILYRSDSKQSLGRLERFRSVAHSIRDNGYITFLDKTLEERKSLFECHVSHTIPRVFGKNKIDDGRHRVTAMLANGIEYGLVAYCEHITIPRENCKAEEVKINDAIRKAAFKFIKEEQDDAK